jgi:integrase
MAYLGLRPSEIARIRRDDIGEADILVRTGKGGRLRTLPLVTAEARLAIEGLIAHGAFGKPFSTHSMYKSWKRAQEKAGPGPFIRPYDLRHSFGTRLYAATGDQHVVAKALGHSQLSTTNRYTLAAVPAALQRAMESAFGK